MLPDSLATRLHPTSKTEAFIILGINSRLSHAAVSGVALYYACVHFSSCDNTILPFKSRVVSPSILHFVAGTQDCR